MSVLREINSELKEVVARHVMCVWEGGGVDEYCHKLSMNELNEGYYATLQDVNSSAKGAQRPELTLRR